MQQRSKFKDGGTDPSLKTTLGNKSSKSGMTKEKQEAQKTAGNLNSYLFAISGNSILLYFLFFLCHALIINLLNFRFFKIFLLLQSLAEVVLQNGLYLVMDACTWHYQRGPFKENGHRFIYKEIYIGKRFKKNSVKSRVDIL